MHDAGFSLERIGDYVGHSSTYVTNRYRHLLDGHEQEAGEASSTPTSPSGLARTVARGLRLWAAKAHQLSQRRPT